MEEVSDEDDSTSAGVHATSSKDKAAIDEDELKLIRRFHVILDAAQSESES